MQANCVQDKKQQKIAENPSESENLMLIKCINWVNCEWLKIFH